MMAQRSLIRPDQLDSNGSYEFAQLVIDGYSGGDLQDGYLMGIILTDGYTGGSQTLRMDAHDGSIDQLGSGNVTFRGNVLATQNVVIEGDLTVTGTTTSIETEQMVVIDPITAINASGSELLSDWTGFTLRDSDGYRRMGWIFDGGVVDGYWALSTTFSGVSQSDAAPDRAIAYVGEGDSYGDLSSTLPGNSGADKIGISPITDLDATTVQEALETLKGSGIEHTTTSTFVINNDAYASLDENACLIMSGGDGTSLLEGYLCMITDAVNGSHFEFNMFSDGNDYDRKVYIGPDGSTSNVDACVILNAGDGSTAYKSEICLNGDNGRLTLTSTDIRLDGNIELGSGSEDCITFNGVVCSDIVPCCDDAYSIGSSTKMWQDGYFANLHVTDLSIDNDTTISGDLQVDGTVTLGSGPEDCIIFNGVICSDIVPCCDDAYQLGDSTHKFNDGYFTNLNVTDLTATTLDVTTLNATTITTTDINVTGDFQVDGTVTLGSGPEDCIIFNGVICSDIVPCCDDAYQLGDSTHRFNDGYFTNLNVTDLTAITLDVTTLNATTITTTDINVTGDFQVDGTVTLGSGPEDCIIFNGVICSDIIPCCNDAYGFGDSTHRFNDGYFTNLDVINLDVETITLTDLTATTITTTDFTATGNVILGSDSYDCVTFNASVCSDIIPCCDDAYQIGDSSHRWFDAYFTMPTFDNFTPIGDNNSLLGVLQGIDEALSSVGLKPERGVYVITNGESLVDTLDTTRAVNQGTNVDVSGWTDTDFRDYAYIYWNGQLLVNDPISASNQGSIQNDVARKTGSLSELIFAGNLRNKAIIQIVDMR